MKGLLTLNDISTDKIREIIDLALEFKHGKKFSYHSEKKMATMFFENSTRTHYSFMIALMNLGIIPVDFNSEASSVMKGESLYDTVKTFECLGVDGVIIRHTRDGYYKELENINVPIFNAGDGQSDHPTQTLLDLITVYEDFGHFEGLKVTFIGDVKHSRVAHGNAVAMARLGMEPRICGPDFFMDKTAKIIDMEEAVQTSDVLNLLRVQFERDATLNMTVAEYHQLYGMTKKRVDQMKDGAIIIHPAPINRGVEIADEVAECKQSRILRQETNGVYARMAVINMVLEGKL